LPQLVFFRLLQGLFGGGLQPCQQAIVLDTFEPSQRSRGFAVVAFAVIFAPILGPVLGGWITDSYSWRWVFLINVPIGLCAFLAVAELVEDPPWVRRDRARFADIDSIGLGLIALGLGALQIMLDRGEDAGWFGSPSIRLYALLAAMGIAGAIAWLLLTDKPIVNLRALADRNFAVGVVMIALISALLYSSNLLIPSLAQNWLGYTALLAGLLLSPGAIIMVVLIPLVSKYILPNVQTRNLIAFGFFVLGAASWYAHNLTADIDFTTLALFRAVQTVGLAFLFVPNSTLAYSTLPRSLNTDAAALYSMFRNIVGPAAAGPPRPPGRAHEPVRSAVSGAAGPHHAGLHRSRADRRGGEPRGLGTDQYDAKPAGCGACLHGRIRAVRGDRLPGGAADLPVPPLQSRRTTLREATPEPSSGPWLSADCPARRRCLSLAV
jgi:DHA2 family multidrug resistance protein